MKSLKKNIRIIPRLDIKGPNLIKGIQLEGLRVIGNPNDFALKYYLDGADEIIYMDAVASLYERNNLKDLVSKTAENIFVPITVGGGIRSIQDAENLLKAGADKVAINTGAVKNPRLVSEIAQRFGSQCVVLSIEAKLISQNKWEVFIDNGREHTSLDVVDWILQVEKLGAGEILLTSVDREGTRKGYETNLIKKVSEIVNVPLIISGGMNEPENIIQIYRNLGVEAFSMADILHYNRSSISSIKEYLCKNKIPVRLNDEE